ncbi:hypothetical protein DRE_02206 [Drechslerella stenobrocha 248]|uniref:Uncharacterized protein n=1 Tax=Drechslerella stenobrocha 248 TaxID=1043628 RepID=W7I8N5_9PEZI|nr:hypothetical protein DRE_02206 [Drechslerella stenobrocha 248]
MPSETKQLASAALASFLRARHAEVPTSEASRALRRKLQRERRKSQSKSSRHAHAAESDRNAGIETAAAAAPTSALSPRPNPSGVRKDHKKAAISKEEREIRQRILKMRENKRKGKPIIPAKKTVDVDTSDDDL